MKFEIDFNRETHDDVLKELGAKQVPDVEYHALEIEIKDFEELAQLEDKVNEIMNAKNPNRKFDEYYSIIIGFDPPTIYLDKEV